ncbi:transmembrane 4 L6 family member 4 [Oryzias melastigma]|uniref:Transmembrane 4 L6 family member 4-like n=1 Tax=Oryzias melastigma TaxID=30732 RepID=A0A3B3B9Q9_ORYME|nr:transmembrane 4 L6 family member 4 [Oryzias melastigma]
MCTRKCSLFVAGCMYPLVLLSVTCNIMLFFPGWSVQYVKEGHITVQVYYMGGVLGGGVLALITALYIHLTGDGGCCTNRLGMFFSIAFAAVGAAGAVYSFIVAILGLSNGPLCKGDNGLWGTLFKNSNANYLTQRSKWADCIEPRDVVQFNIGLFITLILASFLQAMLCVGQIINGLVGCICGTGKDQMVA